MKVIYLEHSGFLVEWEDIYCLFDYNSGTIPELDRDKSLYVFVSHAHGDHYNRSIWGLREKYAKVNYIVSKDVPLSAGQRIKLGLQEADEKRILRVRADETYHLPEGGPEIKTLRSTDAGVAFLVGYAGRTIFHAGDLNLWTWPGESAKYNDEMRKNFLMEMVKIKDLSLDAAFFPLDPRQEEDCGKGLEIFNRTAVVKTLFPMHFWGTYDTIPRYIAAHESECSNIKNIEYEGQVFNIR